MRPINTATAPIGAVKNVSQGNTPKALDPSFNASSTNIDAIRATDRGRMAKTMPPTDIIVSELVQTAGVSVRA